MRYSKKYEGVLKSGLISYNPETGLFFGLDNVVRKTRVDHRGYLRLSVSHFSSLLAHRLAWALYYGELPDLHIDHIDGDKRNNSISNLRICSHNENQHNQGIRSTNKSGYKGVSFAKNIKKWHAQICVNKKVKSLGFFEHKVDAARAYDQAAINLHGEFAWTNFPKS